MTRLEIKKELCDLMESFLKRHFNAFVKALMLDDKATETHIRMQVLKAKNRIADYTYRADNEAIADLEKLYDQVRLDPLLNGIINE